MSELNINVGNKVTFKCLTRSGKIKATRKVTAILENSKVTVTRFHGWKNFIVNHSEIISINN